MNYLKDGTSETMGYDPEGNLNSVANATVGYTLSYDALNRLTSKLDSRGRSLSFTWDKASHIQTKTTYQAPPPATPTIAGTLWLFPTRTISPSTTSTTTPVARSRAS